MRDLSLIAVGAAWLALAPVPSYADDLCVAFWTLENLFDTLDDPTHAGE